MKWQSLPARQAGRKKELTIREPARKTWRVVLAYAVALLTVLSPALVMGLTQHPAMAQARPEADDLVNQIVNLDQETAGLDARLVELSAKSDALKSRIAGIQAEAQAKQEKLSRKKSALSARVRDIYVNGKVSNIELLLGSSDITEFLEKSDDLTKVASHDARLMGEVKEESKQLSSTLSELKKQKSEVDRLASETSTRRDRLGKARSEKQAVLAKAGEQRAAVEQKSGQVESKMRELNPQQEVTGRRTGRYMKMVATGYSPEEPGLDDSTATGMKATHGVVAVDPSVIALGTRLYIEGYGNAIAGDTGSAIKGNRIDLCFDTLEEVESYGTRTITVEFLD